jgi:hypothetical protein
MSADLTCGRRGLAALGLCIALASPLPAQATLIWDWSYSASGISAGGTLTTVDAADSDGFYLITGITGERNGVTITGLEPAGAAIPGNEPFAVDDLISAIGPQLTGNGFGFSLADGDFANPFFASFLTPATYLEFFSAPANPVANTELPVSFTAAVVPEPGTAALMVLGLGLVAASRSRRFYGRSGEAA